MKRTNLVENTLAYNHYWNWIYNIYLSIFQWENLPNNIPPRFIEKCLTEKGGCIFFKDEIAGESVMLYTGNGRFDIYGIPKGRMAYAVNGYKRRLSKNNSVIIFNNYTFTGNLENIEYYAKRLAEIDRIIDINLYAQKTPIAILCDENQKFTFEQIINKYNGNSPLIFGNKSLSLEDIKVLNLEAPFLGENLYKLKMQILKELFASLGINIILNKQAQYVEAEVISDNSSAMAQRYVMLNPRREAAEEINKMFGTNIKVNFRQDVATLSLEDMNTTSYGIGENQIRMEE